MPTRFAGWNAKNAWAALFALAVLIALGLARPPAPAARAAGGDSDAALYQAIMARVADGQDYYDAAAAEQRGRGYPLKPFVTMRPPLLAWTIAALGPSGALVAMRLLMAAALIATVLRLRCAVASRPLWIGASLVAALATAALASPSLLFWHEAWAALLMALALACRSIHRWWPAVVLALVAALFRELAAPLLAVMAWQAWREGGRREAAAWVLAIALFLTALGWHALHVIALAQPGDLASPGWAQAGGWGFVLSMTGRSSLFAVLPVPLTAVLTPLALLGWIGWRGGYAARVATLLGGYTLLFMLIGRPTNFYWGLLLAPLLPAGVAFAPMALRDLGRAARHRPAREA